MANYNKVMLMGNLTRDIDLKYTPSGMAVTKIGLAVNHRYRDTKTNELREEVTFVDIDVWGKQAETMHQYLAKGRSVFIEGRLKLDSWDDKTTGKKAYKLKVVCENFQFVGGNPGGAAAGGAPGGGYPNTQPAARSAPRPLPQRSAPQMPQHAPMQQQPQQDYGGDMQDGPPPDDLAIGEDNVPF